MTNWYIQSSSAWKNSEKDVGGPPITWDVSFNEATPIVTIHGVVSAVFPRITSGLYLTNPWASVFRLAVVQKGRFV